MKNTYRVDEATTAALDVGQIRRLLQYLRPYTKQLILTAMFMFAATLSDLIGPYLLQKSIDVYIPAKDLIGLIYISLLYLGSLGFNYICNRQKIAMANKTGQWVLLDMRRDLFNHVQDLSFNFFDNNSAGKILTRIVNDINTLNNLFTNGIVNVITDFSMLFVAAALMIIIHPRLAAVTFAVAPFFMLGLFLTRNIIKKQWRLVRAKISNLNAYIAECINGMRVIQAYVRQDENRRIFHNLIGDIFNSWMKAMVINSGFGPMVELVSAVGTILIFWYGARLLSIDAVTVGVLVAFTGYLKRFWNPVNTLSNFYNQLLVAMASAERVFELMDQKPQIVDMPGAKELPPVKGEVIFENVTFAYEEDRPVLDNVSFKVAPGEVIALVGPTGSGKTTIVNLLARFYDVTEGRILIDGYDVKYVTLESLRKRIGIMMQEPFIFSGTIMDNIIYGKPDASEEDVVRVAKAVGAHEFISRMKYGYQTKVHERGSGLSIGQRQLIAFARVMLADPDILILDEATASVDTHTEILLQKAIEKLLEGRTSFVIAHRLSTIRNADRIMVIKNGRIVETGTHEELLNNKGLYYDLYSVQYKFLKAV